MKTLTIDVETYSDQDISKCGVYRYAESRNFELLLFGYSVDFGPVKVIDIAKGEYIPDEIIRALLDKNVEKYAFNANFERVVLSRYLGYPTGKYLDPSSWYCHMVWSATLGLPMSLESVGEVLGLDKQKLKEGKDLIKYFCIPQTPKKSNGNRIRNRYYDDMEKWELFKTYNKRDVETELEIHSRLSRFPVQTSEWDNYHLDQKINDAGIMLDMDFVHHAIKVSEQTTDEAYNKAIEITGIDNPNSSKQLLKWMDNYGYTDLDSLSKDNVKELLKDATGDVKEVLKLRQELAKSSIKKYYAMQNVVCSDNRARGLIQFYGANRTGRFAGRLIQVQNLVSNTLEPLEDARELIRREDIKTTLAKFGAVSSVLSELIRTAFIPKKGTRYIVSDYSSIEARVLAWYANETWRLELFESGGDIYCRSASKMFGIPVEKNGVNGEYRKVGKVAELACGYGGSVGALKAFGAVELGLKEEDLKGIIDRWRAANPRIVKMWWDIDKAVKYVISTHEDYSCYGLEISYERGILFIKLPSGRRLAYCKPRLGVNSFGTNCVIYEGIGQNKKWCEIESYGPKFVENITQATARDILCDAMQRLDKLGYKIVMHVHDEVVLEVPDKTSDVKEIGKIMSEAPSWYDGILKADGYECSFYKKE